MYYLGLLAMFSVQCLVLVLTLFIYLSMDFLDVVVRFRMVSCVLGSWAPGLHTLTVLG